MAACSPSYLPILCDTRGIHESTLCLCQIEPLRNRKSDMGPTPALVLQVPRACIIPSVPQTSSLEDHSLGSQALRPRQFLPSCFSIKFRQADLVISRFSGSYANPYYYWHDARHLACSAIQTPFTYDAVASVESSMPSRPCFSRHCFHHYRAHFF